MLSVTNLTFSSDVDQNIYDGTTWGRKCILPTQNLHSPARGHFRGKYHFSYLIEVVINRCV